MAARPVSANGNRYSESQYSQSNDIPEIARFKVFIIILKSISLNYFRMKISFYFNSIFQVEQHVIMKVQWYHQ
jgi:hypothetical protein